MGARSGNNYLSALKKLRPEISIDGEGVRDITSHPRLARSARAIASLYDMQMERPEAMTFRIDDGGRAGMSFVHAGSREDLHRRTRMMKAWADYGCGFLEATPDRPNAVIAAMASAHEFFAVANSRYGDNLRNYYLESRSRDRCASLVIDPPPRDGSPTSAVGLKVVEKSGTGIVIDGSLMPDALAPMSEELIIVAASMLEPRASSNPALALAVPANAKGLRLFCEIGTIETGGQPGYPLSSRFNQPRCVAVFENVTVPWERVFLCGEIADMDLLFSESGVAIHAMHQQAIRSLAKCEFLLGLAAYLARFAGSIVPAPERIPEMASVIETIRARLFAAEANARPNGSGIFEPERLALDAVRAMSSRLLVRLAEAIGPFGSSFAATGGDGPGHDLSDGGPRKLQLEKAGRLAWDATFSPMAIRQMEREPVLDDEEFEAAAAAAGDDSLAPLIERVEAFLARAD